MISFVPFPPYLRLLSTSPSSEVMCRTCLSFCLSVYQSFARDYSRDLPYVSFVIVYYNFSLFFPLLFSRFLFALRLCLCLSSPSHSFPPFLSISLHSSPRLLPSFFFFLLRHPLFFLFPLSPSFTPSLLPLPFLSHCRRSHSLSPSLFPSLIV